MKRSTRYLLPDAVIKKCEYNPLKKKEEIEPYIKKWKKYLYSTFVEMEDLLQNASVYKNRNDKDTLRTDMLFCRLAYGFLPSEYVGFELEDMTPDQRKEYVSDTDMNVFGYTVNNYSKSTICS